MKQTWYWITDHWVSIALILGSLAAVFHVYKHKNELQLYWLDKGTLKKRKKH
ncbi:hypothetical protein [Paenibacillus sp. FJAT-26967]|uniref:hypothetical protein n=1 Tax=Paenibacillus sp. FJAT-26967 TaxID=1729690 RepID=UPI000A82998B|nr:hypothetical protein [Paenibacillus sp. FJAT-26967]